MGIQLSWKTMDILLCYRLRILQQQQHCLVELLKTIINCYNYIFIGVLMIVWAQSTRSTTEDFLWKCIWCTEQKLFQPISLVVWLWLDFCSKSQIKTILILEQLWKQFFISENLDRKLN